MGSDTHLVRGTGQGEKELGTLLGVGIGVATHRDVGIEKNWRRESTVHLWFFTKAVATR